MHNRIPYLISVLFFLGSFFCAAIATGQEMSDQFPDDAQYVTQESIRDRQRKIEIALQLESYAYETDDKWPYNYISRFAVSDKVERNGYLAGAYGSYTWRFGEALGGVSDLWYQGPMPGIVKLEGEGSGGKVDYRSYATGRKNDFDAWDINGRILMGYDFQGDDLSSMVSAYLGFGYRRYSDDSGGYVDYFVYNYAEFPIKHSYYYVPVVVEYLKELNDHWDLTLKLEGDILIDGSVEYYLSDIEGTFSGRDVDTGESLILDPRNVKVDLNGGYGFGFSAKMIRKLQSHNIFVEPFVKFWYIDKSDEQQVHSYATNNGRDYVSVYDDGSPYKPMWEPENVTVKFGGRVGVQF